MSSLEILYQDQYLVAVNKPTGMLVHKTKIAEDVKSGFALQILRDQLDQYVYPLHRIDRPTSGILLFAFSSEIASKMKLLFDKQEIKKEYLLICRGHFAGDYTEEKPLKKINGNEYQESSTHFSCLAHAELDLPNDRYATTRFSLIKASPLSGRMHQIRRHLKHLGYPIIGDTTYGDLKLNNIINANIGATSLCLHAHQVFFKHPVSGSKTKIQAQNIPEDFMALCITLQIQNTLTDRLVL